MLFVPFANVVIIILIWMGIAENRGKPSWWGLVTLIPFVGFAVPGYLAWSELTCALSAVAVAGTNLIRVRVRS